MVLKIKVKYHADIDRIEKLDRGDFIDLRCAEQTYMTKGEFKMIPLGISVQLPEGYSAIVVPRSSTFKNYGIILVNSMGVIDSSYCGDNDQWHFLAYAMRDTCVPKNARIAQFRLIAHQPDIEIETVDTLGNPDRGGIGSTGRY